MIARATAALTKLEPIWTDNISLVSKVKLIRSLGISTLLHACESWTLTAELEKRTQGFKLRCYRRLLLTSRIRTMSLKRLFADRSKQPFGNLTKLLTVLTKLELRWFGSISWYSGLGQTILQGTMERKRHRQKKGWEEKVTEWTVQAHLAQLKSGLGGYELL